MKKTILILIILLLISSNAIACSCGYDKITQDEYDNYSLIFIGEIIEVEDCDNWGYQEFSFKIERLFKGQTTEIVSGFNNCGGICNSPYKLGEKWLVYSNPNYGLINDQHACNQSTRIALKNKVLIDTDYNISKQDWDFEIDFLENRITNNVMIVNFQFIKFVPLLRNIFILVMLFLFLLICYKFNLKLLGFSVCIGVISGFLYYLFISSDLFLQLKDYRIINVFIILGVLFVSSFLGFRKRKDKYGFKELFYFNYLIYITTVITCLYIIVLNEYQKIEYPPHFYKILFFILIAGIMFSVFVALIILIGRRIKLKKLKRK